MTLSARDRLGAWISAALLVSLAVAPAGRASAQVGFGFLTPTWVGAPREDYLRLLQLTGAAEPSAWLIRPESPPLQLIDHGVGANPWLATLRLPTGASIRNWSVSVFDPEAAARFNSRLPSGENDGALWSGRGVSAMTQFGAELRLGPARMTLAPLLVYSENQRFPLAPVNAGGFTPYANADYPVYVDLPQRPGARPLARLDPGQSGVRLDLLGLSAGVSTENQWWGPGVFSSILMSDNAPGLEHAFVRSARPFNIGIGHIGGAWTVGRMYGSGYSTIAPDSIGDRRWLNALGVTFTPWFARTLYLGAFREFYKYIPADGIHLRDLTSLFQPLDKAALPDSLKFRDATDQMATVMFRWLWPSSGFEVYGEWARNDHSWDTRDFILSPEHASGYLLGLQKVFVGADGFVRLVAETIDLPGQPADLIREAPIWYLHSQVVEGYTERGQLIGSADGPVGSAARFRVDLYRPWGQVGGQFSLVRHPDSQRGPSGAIPTRPALTLSTTRILRHFEWNAALTLERQLNEYFVAHQDVSNVALELGGVWRFGVGDTREQR